MTRPNKGKASGPPEKWAPGRTFDSIKEMRLKADVLSEAARLLAVEDEKRRVELTEELQSIARSYWEQHRDTESPPAEWYRTKVGAIQKAAEHLLKLLSQPRGTALVQLRFRTEQIMGRRLFGHPGEEPLSVQQFLEDFAGACRSCRFNTRLGRKPKNPIKVAVAALRKVWITFTSKKFPLNLLNADNRRDRGGRPVAEQGHAYAFTSSGPRFVQVMMQRIDPNVSFSSIHTSLREACVKARRVD